jgi:hypothetical protein
MLPISAAPHPTKARTTVYIFADGHTEHYIGGTPAWRNHNPGNLRPSRYHKGQIGTAGGFAVFASAESGFAALKALLARPFYTQKTLTQAMAAYAPPADNNPTPLYTAFVALHAGLGANRLLSTLTDAERTLLVHAIAVFEKATPGTVVSSTAAPSPLTK